MHYSDGNTFGRTCGLGWIEQVFLTHEVATKHAKAIENGAPSVRGYQPWTEYFASLDNVEVACVPLTITGDL